LKLPLFFLQKLLQNYHQAQIKAFYQLQDFNGIRSRYNHFTKEGLLALISLKSVVSSNLKYASLLGCNSSYCQVQSAIKELLHSNLAPLAQCDFLVAQKRMKIFHLFDFLQSPMICKYSRIQKFIFILKT